MCECMFFLFRKSKLLFTKFDTLHQKSHISGEYTHGLLSFFYETDTQCWGYDPKDQGCARVYWFEDLSALSAAVAAACGVV